MEFTQEQAERFLKTCTPEELNKVSSVNSLVLKARTITSFREHGAPTAATATVAPTAVATAPVETKEQVEARHKRVTAHINETYLAAAIIQHNAKVQGAEDVKNYRIEKTQPVPADEKKLDPLDEAVRRHNEESARRGKFFTPGK